MAKAVSNENRLWRFALVGIESVCACIFHHWAYAMCFDDPTARPILDCIYHQFGPKIYIMGTMMNFRTATSLTATKRPCSCRDIKVQTYKMCATFYSSSFSFGLLLTIPIQDICGLRLKKLIDWVASLAHTPAIEIAGDAQTSKSNTQKNRKFVERTNEERKKTCLKTAYAVTKSIEFYLYVYDVI